jgi:hypothetical protein
MFSTGTTRRAALRLALAAPLTGGLRLRARAATGVPIAVWHDAGCLCCEGWVRHMRQAGFSVTAQATSDMAAVKQAHGVPEALRSCHTAIADGYIIEGHVPASDVGRLLGAWPRAAGLAAPGMPASAPGMDQPGEPYLVILFGAPAGEAIFARH